ncbi:MAG: hypothetical protein R3C19_21090 [Planctomycetaceae bacterium]
MHNLFPKHHPFRGVVMLVAAVTGISAAAMAEEDAVPVAEQINAANVMLRDGQIDEAINAYQRISTPQEHHDELNYNLAVAEYRKGHLDSAEQRFREVSGSASSDVAAKSRYNLGNCAYARALQLVEGDRPAAIDILREAISHYRSSLRIDPNNTDARANIELAAELIRKLQQEEEEQEQRTNRTSSRKDRDKSEQDKQNDQQEQQQQEQQQQQESESQSDDSQKDQSQQNQDRKDDRQQQSDAGQSDSESNDKESSKQDTESDSNSPKPQDSKPDSSSEPGEQQQEQSHRESDDKQQQQQESSEQRSQSKAPTPGSERTQAKDMRQESGGRQRPEDESAKNDGESPDKPVPTGEPPRRISSRTTSRMRFLRGISGERERRPDDS